MKYKIGDFVIRISDNKLVRIINIVSFSSRHLYHVNTNDFQWPYYSEESLRPSTKFHKKLYGIKDEV